MQLLGDELARLLLEDVAESTRLQRREQVLVVVVDRHHHALRLGLQVAQLGHHVDAAAVGQAEVDQREVELDRLDELDGVVDPCAFRQMSAGEDLEHELAQPGPDLGQVFKQQDGLHGWAAP